METPALQPVAAARSGVASRPPVERPAPVPRPDTEELASVVVAAEERDDLSLPWYVRLRAWLFCLLFLCLAEVAARCFFDTGVRLRHERFDNFPNAAAENAFVAEIRRDHAFRVVMIGDSVVVGPSLLNKDQTIPRYLERALMRRIPGREIHVWNFAIAGSRASDELCVLDKVLEAKPDLVIVEGNFMMFASRVEAMPIANPWLAYNLDQVPPAVRKLLPPRSGKQAFEEGLTDLVEENWRLYGLRQVINGLAFGVQPRVPFGDPNPAIMVATAAGKRVGALKMESWKARGLSPDIFRGMYTEDVRPGNLNGSFYPIILSELRRHSTPAYTYLTPQNPDMLAAYMPPDVYAERRAVARSFFADPTIPCDDLSTALPSGEFYDNDHLLAAGNRDLAERIALALAPRIQVQLEHGGPRVASATPSREARVVTAARPAERIGAAQARSR